MRIDEHNRRVIDLSQGRRWLNELAELPTGTVLLLPNGVAAQIYIDYSVDYDEDETRPHHLNFAGTDIFLTIDPPSEEFHTHPMWQNGLIVVLYVPDEWVDRENLAEARLDTAAALAAQEGLTVR